MFAPKHPSEFGSGMGMPGGLAGHAEEAALVRCVGRSVRWDFRQAPLQEGRRRGATEKRGARHTSTSFDDLVECERKRRDA